MSDIKKAALAYENERGVDCLNGRTQPGTPVGECIYIFCGCDINKAFLAGAAEQAERDAYMEYRALKAEVKALLFQDALQRISKDQDYVESQSTGVRQYFDTEGARIAKEALAVYSVTKDEA